MSPVQTVTYVSGLDTKEYGDPGRIRTCDHSLRRRVLYPAELRGLNAVNGTPVGQETRAACHVTRRNLPKTPDKVDAPAALGDSV